MTPRAFVSKARCIYTGDVLDPTDEKLKPSNEHVIPLALGGSNQFTTADVSDDAVAGALPFLMLRQTYNLVGHRKTVPSVKISGEFLDIGARARCEIEQSGALSFTIQNETQVKEVEIETRTGGATKGTIIKIGSTEERARILLRARLEQARSRKLSLYSQFGEIKDEEDIEVALSYADRNEGRQFKGRVTVDVNAMNVARARRMVKIALGLGHRVLGPEWTFGPGGMMLRAHLFPAKKDLNFGDLRGTIDADVPKVMKDIFGFVENRHVMAVLPMKQATVAIVSLFGGVCGTAVIDLHSDQRRRLNRALRNKEPFDCAFSIPLDVPGSRPLEVRSIQELGPAWHPESCHPTGLGDGSRREIEL
jgi:hypothetical protein